MTRKRKPKRKTNRPPLPLDAPGRKNLRPIKPGEVRNPLGKNGYETLKAFRDFFAEEVTEKLGKGAPRREDGDSRYRILLKALFRNGANGSDQALKLAFEQLQGRARQSIEVSSKDGNGPVVQFMLPENGRDVAPPAPPETSGDEKDEGSAE